MKFPALAILLTILAVNSYAGDKARIREMERFIDSVNTSPVDYVFGLFEKYDIVILCERDHRDISQYALIMEVIGDPRFEMVSDIMCEVGSYNFTDKVNSLLERQYEDKVSFYLSAMGFIKDMTYLPLWNKTNFLYLLSHINDYNVGFPEKDNVKLTLLDVPFDWADESVRSYEGYWDFYRTVMPRRERIMADNFIESFVKSEKGKALVILNSPHSYQGYYNKYFRETAAQYIFEAYPGKTANVFINWTVLSDSDNDNKDRLIDKGSWDRAFANCEYMEIGFDFAGSPFGSTPFRDMIKPLSKTTYQDVFTGMIYYRSPLLWVAETGFTYAFPALFEQEYIERIAIIRGKMDEQKYKKFYLNATRLQRYRIYSGNSKIKRQLAD